MLFLNREDGQGLVEYALILVLVAIVVIAILTLLGIPLFGWNPEMNISLGVLGLVVIALGFVVSRHIAPVLRLLSERCEDVTASSSDVSSEG